MKEKWYAWVEWSTRSVQNLAVSLVSLLGLAFLLLFLANWIPSVITERAISEATQTIAQAKILHTEVSGRHQAETPWYKPSYSDGLDEKLREALNWLGDYEWSDEETRSHYWGAQRALAKAKGLNPDEVLYWANTAQKSAAQAQALLQSITETLNENQTLRQKARQELKGQTDAHVQAVTRLKQPKERFSAESGQYLKQYMNPLEDALKQSETVEQNARSYLQSAQEFLPEDNSIQGRGDPRSAQAETDKAKVEIQKINTLAQQVTTSLDYQKEASQNAKPRTDQAKGENEKTWGHIQGIVQSRSFSLDKALSQAHALYRQAEAAYQKAENALQTPIAQEGGKIDYPLAYESAKSAITLAGQATTEANRQVAMADEANANIAKYPARFAEVSAIVERAKTDFQTLASQHARETWTTVASAVDNATRFLGSAQLHFGRAKDEVSLTVQRFADAIADINQAFTYLGNAQSEAQSLISHTATLEGYHRNWPGVESTAISAINSASPTVNSLRSYSSRAVSELGSANGDLTTARSYAAQKRWHDAINSAQSAVSRANNAASWAKADKASHDAAEEARKRAEEAARRAAEEQRRRSSDSFTSPSRGGGFSSPSGGWSSGRGSDNNSWGSGRSSDNNSW